MWASGVSWNQLLADLTREVAALETLDLSTDTREREEVRKGYSLLASLNLSLRQLLSGRTLADGTPTYRFHDLLHDMARRLLTSTAPESKDMLPGLGLTLPVAHAQLLDRYWVKTENGL